MEIINLKPSDVGRWVEYDPGHGDEHKQRGRIKSWNGSYVFVVYHCNKEWDKYKNYTGCATDPNDLVFIGGPKNEDLK
jgi:hypothetical protein